MSPKIYWQSVQLSSLLAVRLVRLVGLVGPGLGVGFAGGCDAEGCGFGSSPASQGSRDPRPLERPGANPLTSPSPNGSPAPISAALVGADASDFDPKVDPPPPAGDLQAEIDAFTTEAACVESRSKVDPLLGDVLDAIGYDTFLSDACRLLDAAKSRDAKRCEAIDASLLRERCEATVAEIAADPDACPWAIEGRTPEGRDPACLAIALRDPRLCAGVIERRGRVTCEAVATQGGREPHAAKICGSLGGQAAAQCLRAAARWARVLGSAGEAPPAAAPLPPSETLTYSLTTSGGGEPSATVDLHVDVQRGLVLVQSHDGWRVRVGAALDDDADLIAPAPYSGASFSFELFVPTGGGAAVVERAAMRVPGHSPVTWSAAHGSMTATVHKLEPSRAGTVELSLDGDAKSAAGAQSTNGASAAGGAWHVHADVRTFIRDTVRAGDSARSGRAGGPAPGAAGPRDRGGRLDEY